MFRMMSGGTPLMVTATALFAFLSLLPLDARANDLEGDREGGAGIQEAGIEGRVVSSEGDPLRGAAVTIRHQTTGEETQVYTGANGRFSFSGLEGEAIYDVQAEALGYRSEIASGVSPST